MGSLSWDIDVANFGLSMQRYVLELRQDAGQVIREQARLLIELLIKLTPPRTAKQGKAAIKRDIRRAIGLVDVAIIRNAKLRAAFEQGNVGAANAMMRRLKGKWQNLEAIPFTESAHTERRDSRGRVLRTTGKLALPAPQAADYEKRVEKRSGQAKAGWLAPYYEVGGTKVPGWIQKHAFGQFGVVNDVQLNGRIDNPHITFTNHATGIQAVDEARLRAAIRYRTEAMAKHVDRMLKLISKYMAAPSVNQAQSTFLRKYGIDRS